MIRLGCGIAALLFAALPAWACSVGCVQDVEVRNGFTVEVLFQGRPLEGASIELKHDQDLRNTTFVTGPEGKASIRVPEGRYSLTVRKFGTVVGNECAIRVSEVTGKRTFTYEWSDTPEPVARVSGRFSHQLYAELNGRRELAPLPSWKMTLHAIDGPVRQASVAADGTFDFGPLQPGLYVLEAPAAEGTRPILLRLDSAAKRRDLDLILADGYCVSGGLLFRDMIEAPRQ